MGSVVDSLKRLYRKIGGKKIKGPIAIDDLVDKIADQMEAGGNVLNVEMTITLGSPNLHGLNKTYGEICNAFTQGVPVIINSFVINNNGNVTPPKSNSGVAIVAVYVDPDGPRSWRAQVAFYEDGAFFTITNVYPSLDAAMNGYPDEGASDDEPVEEDPIV